MVGLEEKKNGLSLPPEFLRAKFNQEDGLVSIYPFEGSGRLSSLSWSNGIVELSDGEQNIEKGDLVDFIPYESFF